MDNITGLEMDVYKTLQKLLDLGENKAGSHRATLSQQYLLHSEHILLDDANHY